MFQFSFSSGSVVLQLGISTNSLVDPTSAFDTAFSQANITNVIVDDISRIQGMCYNVAYFDIIPATSVLKSSFMMEFYGTVNTVKVMSS